MVRRLCRMAPSLAAEREARDQGLGVWANDPCTIIGGTTAGGFTTGALQRVGPSREEPLPEASLPEGHYWKNHFWETHHGRHYSGRFHHRRNHYRRNQHWPSLSGQSKPLRRWRSRERSRPADAGRWVSRRVPGQACRPLLSVTASVPWRLSYVQSDALQGVVYRGQHNLLMVHEG